MCRWIAYKGKPVFLEELLLKPSNSLIDQSLECRQGNVRTNGDGFGIGWYAHRQEPGLYREVLPAWNDCNLRTLARQIKSGLFFAHVRSSTGTETARLNCHPFAYGRWLFMHNGRIDAYERCRRQLESLLSDELYARRMGSTDSEVLFLLMIQNGLERDPLAALRFTIRQITEVAETAGSHNALHLTISLSDGQRLYACRHDSAATPPTLYWKIVNGDILVASEPVGDEATAWNEIQPDEVLIVDDGINVVPLFLDDSDLFENRAAAPARKTKAPQETKPAAIA